MEDNEKELMLSMTGLLKDADFLALDRELTRFNPFEVLGVKSLEIRHSNMLAWFFDPYGTHGLVSSSASSDGDSKGNIVILIENKVYSKQGKDQLEDYIVFAEDKFDGALILPVYLTLNEGDGPATARGFSPWQGQFTAGTGLQLSS